LGEEATIEKGSNEKLTRDEFIAVGQRIAQEIIEERDKGLDLIEDVHTMISAERYLASIP